MYLNSFGCAISAGCIHRYLDDPYADRGRGESSVSNGRNHVSACQTMALQRNERPWPSAEEVPLRLRVFFLAMKARHIPTSEIRAVRARVHLVFLLHPAGFIVAALSLSLNGVGRDPLFEMSNKAQHSRSNVFS